MVTLLFSFYDTSLGFRQAYTHGFTSCAAGIRSSALTWLLIEGVLVPAAREVNLLCLENRSRDSCRASVRRARAPPCGRSVDRSQVQWNFTIHVDCIACACLIITQIWIPISCQKRKQDIYLEFTKSENKNLKRHVSPFKSLPRQCYVLA